MKRKSWELKLIFLVLVAVFAIFLAVPAIRLLLKSFLGEDGLTGVYYLVFNGALTLLFGWIEKKLSYFR